MTVEPTEPGCAEEGDRQGGPLRDQLCWECDHSVGFGSMNESLGEGGELGAERGDAFRHCGGVGLARGLHGSAGERGRMEESAMCWSC